MAEYRVRKGDIIYIIPNDELFEKYNNGEAFIDEYGRLMNRKPHRVLKELKHHAVKPVIQNNPTLPPNNPTKGSSPKDYLLDMGRDVASEVGHHAADVISYKIVYEWMPRLWHEHIVPGFYNLKDALTTKETKAETIIKQSTSSTEIAITKTKTTLTAEEANAEKRKVLYHWLGMLSSLKKLQDAGEINAKATLAQLTAPDALQQVNRFLSENPNLLETDKYIELHGLLGRDLYMEKQLIPIEAAEVNTIAEKFGYISDDTDE